MYRSVCLRIQRHSAYWTSCHPWEFTVQAMFHVLVFFVMIDFSRLNAALESLIVRYAVLDPEPLSGYLQREGLSMLRSTLCLAEKHLTPALTSIHWTPPSYIIYTDTGSHEAVALFLFQNFQQLTGRIQLINLDEDPNGRWCLEQIQPLQLDPVNLVSVRRTLADVVLLPPKRGRLLLGLDISFIISPTALTSRINMLNQSQALYMIDLESFKLPYTLPAFTGPQCPGLLGDFVYLAPGVHISTSNILQKLLWYADQPRVPERTHPPSDVLAPPDKSNLHALDQFALNLALAEAVVPPGPSGCHPLSVDEFRHRGGTTRQKEWTREFIEVMHDKVISSCGATCFDQCEVVPSADPFVGQGCEWLPPQGRCLKCMTLSDSDLGSCACLGPPSQCLRDQGHLLLRRSGYPMEHVKLMSSIVPELG